MSEHTPAPTPSRAVYGFALQLSFKLVFIIYVVWAVVPEKWFESVGVTYLPQRYWAIAIPIFLLTVLATFAFIIYPGLGLIMTPDWSDIRTTRDSHSINGVSNVEPQPNTSRKYDILNAVCCPHNKNQCKKTIFDARDQKEFSNLCIKRLEDLDIVDVSKHLYLK